MRQKTINFRSSRIFSVKKKLYVIGMMVVLIGGCTKTKAKLNITLYNQPLPVIKSYIAGKWTLEYEYGGFCGTCFSSFHGSAYIWEFDQGTWVKQSYKGLVETDTSIDWIKDQLSTVGPDSTFVLSFYDKRQYPNRYQVQGIFNDSLVLHDWVNGDAVSYHFSKQN
jgi:hypothetical protein